MIDPHPTRTHLLALLRRGGGATLYDLQRATGLSRSALRQHLTLLERDGLVRERLQRGRAGRPPILYEPVPPAGREPTESYAAVLAAVFGALGEQGPAAVGRIVQTAAARIAERYGDISAIPDVDRRLAAVLQALLEDPGAAQIRRVGPDYELILPACPFLALVGESPEVCAITRELLVRLVGGEVEQREWIVRGDPRCSFVLKPGRRHRRAPPEPQRRASTERRRGRHG